MVAFLGATFGVVCQTLSRLFRNVVSSPSGETFHQAAIPDDLKPRSTRLSSVGRLGRVFGGTPNRSNGFLDRVEEIPPRGWGEAGRLRKASAGRLSPSNRHRHGIVLRSPRTEI